jgi:hypothetical protein
VHLVLGSERYDLRARAVVVARVEHPGQPAPGADAVWVADPAGAGAHHLPVGADAVDADHVHRLADAGVSAVGIAPGDRRAASAAEERGLTVLVTPDDVADAAALLPPERVLVCGSAPRAGAVACCTPDGTGPAAWAQVTVAMRSGVRVVRTNEPGSVRRVATVVQRLVDAREVLR